MSTKLFLLSLIILLSHSFISAQTKEELLSFYNKFEPVEFDLLHIYTNGQQEQATFKPKSSYPFQGKKIASFFAPFLGKCLDIEADQGFFAISRYTIAPQIEGLLIRMYDKEMLSNSIYALIYNHKTNSLEEGIQLAYDYQAEGGSGAVQSWLLDLNEDGLLDVLTRSYYDYYELKEDSDDLEHIHKEESHLVVFDNLKLKSTLVDNRTLQQNLEEEFPYRSIQVPFMKEKTQKDVFFFIKKGGLLIPSEHD